MYSSLFRRSYFFAQLLCLLIKSIFSYEFLSISSFQCILRPLFAKLNIEISSKSISAFFLCMGHMIIWTFSAKRNHDAFLGLKNLCKIWKIVLRYKSTGNVNSQAKACEFLFFRDFSLKLLVVQCLKIFALYIALSIFIFLFFGGRSNFIPLIPQYLVVEPSIKHVNFLKINC